MNKNHLRNIRALLENAKEYEVSRKVDTYEYESLEKMILDDQIRYSEVIELFTDKTAKTTINIFVKFFIL